MVKKSGAVVGSLLIVASFSSSGCFLRTQVIYPGPADPVSGYYETTPQSVAYSAVLSSGTINQTASVNAVPTYTASIMTNTILLQLTSPGAATGYLYPTTTNAQIDQSLAQYYTNFSPTAGTFSFVSGVPNGTANYESDAWGTDSSCTILTAFSLNGTIESLSNVNAVVDNTAVSVAGHFVGSVTVSLYVSNATLGSSSCATALGKISACYTNSTDCDSTSGSIVDNDAIQAGYQTIFGQWVDQAQVITAADIASITPDVNSGDGSSLSYQVQYQ